MGLFTYGNYEKELDFTDVEFQEKLEQAQENLMQGVKMLPKTGKISEIMRAQAELYDNYLEHVLGEDAPAVMFDTMSLEKRLDAIELLADCRERSDSAMQKRNEKYVVNKNREQRRREQKGPKNKNRNYRSMQ